MSNSISLPYQKELPNSYIYPVSLFYDSDENSEEKDIHDSTGLSSYNSYPSQKNLFFDQQKADTFSQFSVPLSKIVCEAIKIPGSFYTMCFSPSPYEHAFLAAHAYEDKIKEGDPPVVLAKNNEIMKGWKVLRIFSEKKGEWLNKIGLSNSYRGVLYIHRNKNQMVLAHRGTKLTDISALKTDINSIYLNSIGGGQERHLYTLMQDVIKCAENEKCHLSVTGHSLGGWLTALSLYVVKDLMIGRVKVFVYFF